MQSIKPAPHAFTSSCYMFRSWNKWNGWVVDSWYTRDSPSASGALLTYWIHLEDFKQWIWQIRKGSVNSAYSTSRWEQQWEVVLAFLFWLRATQRHLVCHSEKQNSGLDRSLTAQFYPKPTAVDLVICLFIKPWSNAAKAMLLSCALGPLQMQISGANIRPGEGCFTCSIDSPTLYQSKWDGGGGNLGEDQGTV